MARKSNAVRAEELFDSNDDMEDIDPVGASVADEDEEPLPVVPPDLNVSDLAKDAEVKKKEENLWEYLLRVGLERKIIDIAIAQGQTPNELRRDCEQEIRLIWSTCKADLSYAPGQIASYAHRMAGHAILRVRRDLGSACRLPASAFRKRKDGTTYVTPGLLSKTLDWNAMEDWLSVEGDDFSDSMPMMSFIDEEGNTVMQDEPSYESTTGSPTHDLINLLHKLPVTQRQKQIAIMLAEGYSFAEIQDSTGVKRNKISVEMDVVKKAIKALG